MAFILLATPLILRGTFHILSEVQFSFPDIVSNEL